MTTKDFKIQVFKHPQFGEIRVTGTSDEPLFCLVDICKVLELNNTSMAKRKLKATGIKIFEVRSELTNKHGKTIAFMDNLTFISEQNLYRLIMRSTKPWLSHSKTGYVERCFLPSASMVDTSSPTRETPTRTSAAVPRKC